MEAVLAAALANVAVAQREAHAAVTHDPLPPVVGDAVQLTQVFQNLLGNAFKFRGAAPLHVHVGVVEAPGVWQFSVQDNGMGIDPEYFDRIFLLFQRLHPRRDYGGMGIGLALCKKIVERHGGRIWVESQGSGATFYFTLPRETPERP
jgi:light-regulated signal transduction histidine kinase (bacteriophytochrome)